MSKTTMLIEVDLDVVGDLPAREVRRLLEDEMPRLSTTAVHKGKVHRVDIDEVRVMRVVDDGQITINIPVDMNDIDPDKLARQIAFGVKTREATSTDPLRRAVPLREVLEWVQEWVPKPVRPLWEEAFLKEFAGGSEEPS